MKNLKKRVLIVSCETKSYGALEIIRSFEDKGYQVELMNDVMVCRKRNLLTRIRIKLGLSIEKFLRKKEKRFGERVLAFYNDYKPDIVCDLGGFLLNAETINEIKRDSYISLILMDRICFFPRLNRNLSLYDRIYTYSSDDYHQIKDMGLPCVLCLATGDELRFFKKGSPKKYDLCFVGSMLPKKDYGYRYRLLKKLSRDFPDLKLIVGGKNAPIRHPILFFEWLFNRRYREVFLNKQITYEECNTIFNESKICLNLERINTGNSWSGRFANIIRSGTFIIAQNVECISELLNGSVVMFDTYEDLKEKISFYLKDDVSRLEKESVLIDQFKVFCEKYYVDKVNDIIIHSLERRD